MSLLKAIAFFIIVLYLVAVLLLYLFQTRLIFLPGKLSKDFKFKNFPIREEVFLTTSDGQSINGLFFPGKDSSKVILYFHGNAGDLSGWQFVAEDLLPSGLSVFIIDYRGYGKSTGEISERGLYNDGQAAYEYLLEKKKIAAGSIIVYGRSIGSGVAVEIASQNKCAGLILESAYGSLGALANEKVPFFFPSLYLKTRFDNVSKLGSIQCPVVLIHGTNDSLIPPSHSTGLFKKLEVRKQLLLIEKGEHNNLYDFREYKSFIKDTLAQFFFPQQRYQFHDN